MREHSTLTIYIVSHPQRQPHGTRQTQAGKISENLVPQIDVFWHSTNHGTPCRKHARAQRQERTETQTQHTLPIDKYILAKSL